ncbi:MAG: hypothetical protein SFT91_00955, partial [Rickettsiaceae bacterium]|nr:hypothetical protein [Rickettsiaceae bacterium]
MSFKKLFILASLVLAPTILVAMEPNHSHPRLLNLNALVSAIEKGIRGHALIGVGEMLNSPNAGALSEEQFDQLYVLSKNIFKNLPDNHVSFTRASNIDRLLYFCVCLKGLKFPKVLFTPVPYRDLVSPTLAQALGALILNESHSVSVCCYHLTLFNIAEALVAC